MSKEHSCSFDIFMEHERTRCAYVFEAAQVGYYATVYVTPYA